MISTDFGAHSNGKPLMLIDFGTNSYQTKQDFDGVRYEIRKKNLDFDGFRWKLEENDVFDGFRHELS